MPNNLHVPLSKTPSAEIDVLWVRFHNDRLIPVNGSNGVFEAIVSIDIEAQAEMDPNGWWSLAMSLSFALCGNESTLCRSLSLESRPVGHQRYFVTGTIPNWEVERTGDGQFAILTMDEFKELDASQGVASLGISRDEAVHLQGNIENDYGDEFVLEVEGGRQVRCPGYPDDCDYVRVTLPGVIPLELAYWVSEEWADAPAEVMGALLGALRGR